MLTEPRLFQLVGVITYSRMCDNDSTEIVECEFVDEFEALTVDDVDKKAKKIVRLNAEKILKLEKHRIALPEGTADLYEILPLRRLNMVFKMRETKRAGKKVAATL